MSLYALPPALPPTLPTLPPTLPPALPPTLLTLSPVQISIEGLTMRSEPTSEPTFTLYCQWDTCRVFYVSQLPGEGGVDWGYSENPSKAIPVSRYWQRRFKADCARVGQFGCSFVNR